ncbi:MAG TPA: FeS-binding protein, partial [Algoriphagus sp.]|nr:FeS-binding protein [Algoriphagus sp.]
MKLIQKLGLVLFLGGLLAFTIIPFLGNYQLSEEIVLSQSKEIHQESMNEILSLLYGNTYQ